MLTRVATFANSDQMISNSLSTQARMVKLQQEESTGVVSTDFGGLGASAKRLIDLQTSVDRAQSYIDAASTAKSRAQVMYSACGSMTDLLTKLRSLLSSSTDTTSDSTSIQQSATEMMQEMASLLNTQYDGQYVFGGSRADTKPVDTSLLAAATSPSSADTSYYVGNDDIASVRVSDQQVVDYGVTADKTGFEQALRAFNLVSNNSPLDSTTLSEASTLAETALSDVTAYQTSLSLASAAMERVSSYQTEYQDDAKSLASDLNSVDVAAVTAQLSTYQTQLEASYSAISKIQGLNLVDYLK